MLRQEQSRRRPRHRPRCRRDGECRRGFSLRSLLARRPGHGWPAPAKRARLAKGLAAPRAVRLVRDKKQQDKGGQARLRTAPCVPLATALLETIGRSWAVAMIGNDGKEDRAKPRGLGWSDAGNKQQILARFWTEQRHLDQDAVMEYDEGGLLLVSRDFEAFGLERGEQAVLPGGQQCCPDPWFDRLECLAGKRRILRLRNLDLAQASPHGGGAPARQSHAATQRQRRFARKHGTSCLGDNPTITIFRVLSNQIRRVKLVKNAAPFGWIELFADAECGQEIMAMPPNCVACLADEEVGEVARKKSPGGAADRGHDLLRRDRAVEERPFPIANISIAAGLRGLPESGEQCLAAATRGFAQGNQGVELSFFHPLAIVRRHAVGYLTLAQTDVAVAEQGQGVCGQAIAAGAADFLIIGFDALR